MRTSAGSGTHLRPLSRLKRGGMMATTTARVFKNTMRKEMKRLRRDHAKSFAPEPFPVCKTSATVLKMWHRSAGASPIDSVGPIMVKDRRTGEVFRAEGLERGIRISWSDDLHRMGIFDKDFNLLLSFDNLPDSLIWKTRNGVARAAGSGTTVAVRTGTASFVVYVANDYVITASTLTCPSLRKLYTEGEYIKIEIDSEMR